MSFWPWRIVRLGKRVWDMYKYCNSMDTKPKTEDESSAPPREVDEAKHSNVGRTVYWGCVNRTYHITGDRESVPESAHDDQSGASNAGLKIYVGCVIENYHVTTDRAT